MGMHIAVFSQTTFKTKFVLIESSQVSWNDLEVYCRSVHSGHIVTLQTEAKENAIAHYKQLEWSHIWNGNVWIGLYMTSLLAQDYTWLGTCKSNSFVTSKLSCLPNCNSGSCGYANDNLQWNFLPCDTQMIGICETHEGLCTFEDDSYIGACLKSSSLTRTSSTNMEDCKQKCIAHTHPEECWALSYSPSSKLCHLAYGTAPFEFDDNAGIYSKASCGGEESESDESDTVISWKRCFEQEIDTRPVGTVQFSTEVQPKFFCGNLSDTTMSAISLHSIPTSAANTETTDTPTTTVTSTTTLTSKTTAPPTTTVKPKITATLTTTVTSKTTATPTTTATSITTATPTTTCTTTPTTNDTFKNRTLCPCVCFNKSTDFESVADDIAELKRSLTVHRKQTSAYLRKLTCASDNRLTARSIGLTLGAGVIVTVICWLVSGDVVCLIRGIIHKCKRKNKFRVT